jgi:8-oxo-dGTP pyrophosphatase MutT (NUDIX family)
MNKTKPTKYSVALVIYNQDRSKFLIVKRPLDDDSLPGYWGFPAASKKSPEENWEDTVKRAAKIKLDIEVKIVKIIGQDTIERKKHNLVLRDYEVDITKGKPTVPQQVKGVTQYSNLKWTNDFSDLKKSARDGALCSRIFLRVNNINWQ